MTAPRIHRVTTLDLPVRPWPWPFAAERRAEIDAHFAVKQSEKPKIWNGRILIGRNPVFTTERFRADAHWDCVLAGPTVAMIKVLHVDMPGDALRRRIEANLAGQQMPELSAIHLVRSASDLTSAMPRFVTAFIEAQLST